MEREDRQAVLHNLRSGRIRFDDVARFLFCVRGGARIKVIAPLAVERVELIARIRSLRSPKRLADLALHVEVLVEVHFLPELQSHVGRRRVDRAEVDPRIANRLQQCPHDRSAVVVQDFELRVRQRATSSGVRLDNPDLSGFGVDPVAVEIGRLVVHDANEFTLRDAGNWQRRGGRRPVVRFDLIQRDAALARAIVG